MHVQTRDQKDFPAEEFANLHFLDSDFSIHPNFFQSLVPGSVVVLDDFSFQKSNKQEKLDFLKVVNFHLRHGNITLILLIHNLYSNNLASEILLAPHLILAYSNLGYNIIRYKFNIFFHFLLPHPLKPLILILRKIAPRLGGKAFVDFYQEPVKQNFHFCYINCNKNYIINCVEHLFKGNRTTMFFGNDRFVIHKVDKFCTALQNQPETIDSGKDSILDFITTTYPKQKYLPLLFKQLIKKEFINNDLYFEQHPNIHIADFCTFINNKFGKPEKTDPKFLKLCKYLQAQHVKLPKISIKNPVAQKYLC